MSRFLALLSVGLLAGGAAVAQVNEHTTIAGEVAFPPGQTVEGAIAIVCPEPYDACNNTSRTSVIVPDQGDPQRGLFAVENLDASKRYKVVVWKDNDGDHVHSDGDVLGLAKRGEGVQPGPAGGPISAEMFNVKVLADVEASSSPPVRPTTPMIGADGNITGRWASADAKGAYLTAATAFVEEIQPLADKDRRQVLTILPGGAFKWVLHRGVARRPGCVELVQEEREGKARVDGSKVFLSVAKGQLMTTKSCGASLEGRRDPIVPRTESYGFSASGGVMKLIGADGVTWTFQKR